MCISNTAGNNHLSKYFSLCFPALEPLHLVANVPRKQISPNSSPAIGPVAAINSKQPYGYVVSEGSQDDHSALGISSGVAVAMNLKTAIQEVSVYIPVPLAHCLHECNSLEFRLLTDSDGERRQVKLLGKMLLKWAVLSQSVNMIQDTFVE